MHLTPVHRSRIVSALYLYACASKGRILSEAQAEAIGRRFVSHEETTTDLAMARLLPSLPGIYAAHDSPSARAASRETWAVLKADTLSAAEAEFELGTLLSQPCPGCGIEPGQGAGHLEGCEVDATQAAGYGNDPGPEVY